MKKISIKGFEVECAVCGKKIIGQSQDQVLHNLRVHSITHESTGEKLI